MSELLDLDSAQIGDVTLHVGEAIHLVQEVGVRHIASRGDQPPHIDDSHPADGHARFIQNIDLTERE